MVEFWQDKRVFITGAAGFVGSWLSSFLVERGADVVALIRDWEPQSQLIKNGTVSQLHVVQGALEDYRCVERAISEYAVDTVFHLGAQAIVGVANRSPLPTFESNIHGTYNLLEACRVHAGLVRRVVVASSDKAYGESEILPYTEDLPLLGRHPYDVSKSCTDLLARAYWQTYKLPVAIARCGNIYGGGDLNWSRIVPGTIRSILEERRPIIRSDGLFVRDYIYVEDVVQAYAALAEGIENKTITGEAFNFSPESPVTVLEIVAAIRRAMKREDLEPQVLDEVQAEIRDQYLSSEKARRLLAWEAEYSLEQGLGKTIAWYRAYSHE